ncbi:MAG TPA: PhaM family polyhydroxyalkanoate granule multifunctional regulatory protein [Rugosibacter sp.]
MSGQSGNPTDPMEFLKSLWGSSGMPLPGLVTPTLDTDELEKRITDLKAVEGWLKTNLGMLQMTIQGLEVQRATLTALQAISQSAGSAAPGENPFANPNLATLWPWNLMPSAASTSSPAADASQSTRATDKPAAKSTTKAKRT